MAWYRAVTHDMAWRMAWYGAVVQVAAMQCEMRVPSTHTAHSAMYTLDTTAKRSLQPPDITSVPSSQTAIYTLGITCIAVLLAGDVCDW